MTITTLLEELRQLNRVHQILNIGADISANSLDYFNACPRMVRAMQLECLGYFGVRKEMRLACPLASLGIPTRDDQSQP